MRSFTTSQGLEIHIREAVPEDAEATMLLSREIFGLPTVLTTQAEFHFDIERQRAWIRSHQEDERKLILLALHEDRVVGLLDLANAAKQRIRHNGEFGISVAVAYRRSGIARKMISTMLDWARNNALIEKVALKVTANNPGAVRLYSDLGFQEAGRLKREIKLEDGTYWDTIIMEQIV